MESLLSVLTACNVLSTTKLVHERYLIQFPPIAVCIPTYTSILYGVPVDVSTPYCICRTFVNIRCTPYGVERKKERGNEGWRGVNSVVRSTVVGVVGRWKAVRG
jgi:hypothetical protein